MGVTLIDTPSPSCTWVTTLGLSYKLPSLRSGEILGWPTYHMQVSTTIRVYTLNMVGNILIFCPSSSEGNISLKIFSQVFLKILHDKIKIFSIVIF